METKDKFNKFIKDKRWEFNTSHRIDNSIRSEFGTSSGFDNMSIDMGSNGWGGGTTTIDFKPWSVTTGDKLDGYPSHGTHQWNLYDNGYGKISHPDVITKDDLEEALKNLENYNKKEDKKKASNKVDKDLVDSKVPYNIKKDLKGNLIYEVCCSGFSKEEIDFKIEGDYIYVSAKLNEDDDLIGDDFEFLCYGIKKDLKVNFYIDFTGFDRENVTLELKRGILSIFIPYKGQTKFDIIEEEE